MRIQRAANRTVRQIRGGLPIARSAIPAMTYVYVTRGEARVLRDEIANYSGSQPRGSWSSVSPTHDPCGSEVHKRTTHALMTDFATGPPPEPAGEPREKRS
eukprot:2867372-Prymnesium_polylepis.1